MGGSWASSLPAQCSTQWQQLRMAQTVQYHLCVLPPSISQGAFTDRPIVHILNDSQSQINKSRNICLPLLTGSHIVQDSPELPM